MHSLLLKLNHLQAHILPLSFENKEGTPFEQTPEQHSHIVARTSGTNSTYTESY